MTRIVNHVNQPVTVQTDGETGAPTHVDGVHVRRVLDHFREWIGILQGEPERDIWRVETAHGICEVHLIQSGHPGQPDHPGHWLLARWED